VLRHTRTDDDEREEPERRREPAPEPPRHAGNAVFARWLARAPDDKPAKPKPRVSYVFLMGEMGDPYYRAAREYFESAVKNATVVIDKRTLADVIAHVNSQGSPVDTLYIVSHAGDSGFLQFSLDADDLKKDRVEGNQLPNATFGELKEANDRGTLPKADTKLIDEKTKIKIKGCDIGRSERTLDELDEAFGGKASVSAPTHAQEYRAGGGTPSEHLARMFVEWPGDVKKSGKELAAAFKAKYPMVPEKRWKTLLPQAKKDRRRSRSSTSTRSRSRSARTTRRRCSSASTPRSGGRRRRAGPSRPSAASAVATTSTRCARRRTAPTPSSACRSSRSRSRRPTRS
jgi:hypothetical protein